MVERHLGPFLNRDPVFRSYGAKVRKRPTVRCNKEMLAIVKVFATAGILEGKGAAPGVRPLFQHYHTSPRRGEGHSRSQTAQPATDNNNRFHPPCAVAAWTAFQEYFRRWLSQ
jgi:hypothetical protein